MSGATVALTGPLLGAPSLLPPKPYEFGQVVVGQSSQAHRFSVQSTTHYDSRIESVAVENPQFPVSADRCSGTLLGNAGSCTFDVTFRPGEAGRADGPLIIQASLVCTSTEAPPCSVDPSIADSVFEGSREVLPSGQVRFTWRVLVGLTLIGEGIPTSETSGPTSGPSEPTSEPTSGPSPEITPEPAPEPSAEPTPEPT